MPVLTSMLTACAAPPRAGGALPRCTRLLALLLAVVCGSIAPATHAQEPPPPPPPSAPEMGGLKSQPADPNAPPNPGDPSASAPGLPSGPPVSLEQIQAEQERARQLAEAPPPTSTGPVPQAYPLERYSILWTRSPFLMEVAPTVVETPPSPFQDYALTGVMTIDDFKMASFFHKTENKNYVISTEPKPKDPFKLESIIPGADLASTIVNVSSGGQEGQITYDASISAIRKAAGGGGVPPNQPPQPQAQQQAQQNRPPTPSVRARVNSPNNTNQDGQNRRQRRRVIIPRQVPSR